MRGQRYVCVRYALSLQLTNQPVSQPAIQPINMIYYKNCIIIITIIHPVSNVQCCYNNCSLLSVYYEYSEQYGCYYCYRYIRHMVFIYYARQAFLSKSFQVVPNVSGRSSHHPPMILIRYTILYISHWPGIHGCLRCFGSQRVDGWWLLHSFPWLGFLLSLTQSINIIYSLITPINTTTSKTLPFFSYDFFSFFLFLLLFASIPKSILPFTSFYISWYFF